MIVEAVPTTQGVKTPARGLVTALALLVVSAAAAPALGMTTIDPQNVCEVTNYRPWLSGSSFANAYITLTGHPGVDPNAGGTLFLSGWSDHFGAPSSAYELRFEAKEPRHSFRLPPVKLRPGQDMLSPTLRGRVFFGGDAYKSYSSGALVFKVADRVIATIPLPWGRSALRSVQQVGTSNQFVLKFEGCVPAPAGSGGSRRTSGSSTSCRARAAT